MNTRAPSGHSPSSPAPSLQSDSESRPTLTSSGRRWTLGVLGASLLLLAACGKREAAPRAEPGKPKEVSRVVAAEAEGYLSDALFAVQIKDFARAEQSLAKAVKLRDDIPDWWLQLGVARKKLGKSSDARIAYKKALAIHERAYEQTKDSQYIQGQLYILLLLDDEAEARIRLQKALRAHPDDQELKGFDRAKGIDQLLRNPGILENKV